jgi:DGQHR domain-containing protein
VKNSIQFSCIEVTQPIGSFYVGAIAHSDLLSICYADIRELEDREMDKYLGIQRPLKKERVVELQKYVNLVDATFPTSIILHISSEDAKFDPKAMKMSVRNKDGVAKIIDGQHRIAGLEQFHGKAFELNVTIFVDMDIEDQAIVFSTINIKHTKVSKSLMYDLFEYAKSRSPQKTCHTIARLVNRREDSPLFHKIKVLGSAVYPEETLTQATFVDRLMKYISRDPMSDRDVFRRGKTPATADAKEKSTLVFRNLFLQDEDALIAKIVVEYFSAVSQKWPSAWGEAREGNILNRSTGFAALMRLLGPAYLKLRPRGSGLVSRQEFSKLFNSVKLRERDFTPDNYKPGSSGESLLLKDLLDQTGLNAE